MISYVAGDSKTIIIYNESQLLLSSMLLLYVTFPGSGPGSVVGIASGYGLDGPGIESYPTPGIYAEHTGCVTSTRTC